MNRSIVPRLRRLYERLWTTDALGVLDREVTVLRGADARRDAELAALRNELGALRQTAAERDRELAALRDELGALRETAASRESDAGMVRNAVTALGDQQTRLARRLTTTATRDEVDLLKSSLEVPRELRDEFRDWKVHHPVPARPLVSVCVSTYNRADLLLERCIPSILGQTYDRLELIIVGDGCTDETPDRVARLDDPRVRFVNLPARGHYPDEFNRRWMVAGTPAVNRALDLARGDFVTHLDDDDEYHLDRLEKLVAFVTANGCDVVWHPFWWQVQDEWKLNESHEFAYAQVTTSSVFYRAWFTKIQWNIEAHWLGEPGDWNRFRRFKYLGPVMMRYPEPLLRHYREQTQAS